MSPQRQFSLDSRHPTQISDIFLGLAFRIIGPDEGEGSSDGVDRNPSPTHDHQGDKKDDAGDDDREGEGGDAERKEVTHLLEGTFVLHDGTGIIGSETMRVPLHERAPGGELTKDVKFFKHKLAELVTDLSLKKNQNVRMIAISEPVPDVIRSQGLEFSAKVWLHLDAVPFVHMPKATMFKDLPDSSTQANATSAVQAGVKIFHPATHSATVAECSETDHEVLVDCAGQVKLCRLPQYRDTTSPQLWKRFMALSTHLKERSISIAFFSATPQGGGVALMRHALIRLWRLAGVNVKWYTPEGHPTVFDITKRKIHNVLQGVAKDGVEMTDKDKEWFVQWTKRNYEAFWQNGALDADVIVIDDPQLTALIPIIREKRPDAKIIFRSHIQIQSDLTDKPDTAQYRTWNFLYSFVKQADLFLAHPVKFFVPQNVRQTMPVLYMAPSTDPIDGLNKPYGHIAMKYYRQMFNGLSAKQCGVQIDWEREYICQIARFDPSKGIPDLIKAFLEFRNKLSERDDAPMDGGPQLIIMGHGSIDDPDGTMVYEELHELLGGDEYESVREDVAIVRAPPSDSLLGAILQGAWVATQLSTREGFEVKVTEAIHKRVPMIASDAGGIPLQVKHGKNGWIVPTGDTSAVASLLLDIHCGKISVQRDTDTLGTGSDGQTDPNSLAEKFVSDMDAPLPPVQSDKNSTSEDFWTVGNATRWMLLFSKVLGLPVQMTATEEEEDKGGPQGPMNDWGMDIPKRTSQEHREVLKDMGVGGPLLGKGQEGGNVWKMVMGDDLVEGEGEGELI